MLGVHGQLFRVFWQLDSEVGLLIPEYRQARKL